MEPTKNSSIADETWYADLANEYLGKIRVNGEDGFAKVCTALQSIIEPANKQQISDARLSQQICQIKELLDDPEMFIRPGADKEVFKAVIQRQIAAKIASLNSLGPKERQEHLSEQKQLDEAAATCRDLQSKAKPQTTNATNYVNPEQLALDRQRPLSIRWDELLTLDAERHELYDQLKAINHEAPEIYARLSVIDQRIKELLASLEGQEPVPQARGRWRSVTIMQNLADDGIWPTAPSGVFSLSPGIADPFLILTHRTVGGEAEEVVRENRRRFNLFVLDAIIMLLRNTNLPSLGWPTSDWYTSRGPQSTVDIIIGAMARNIPALAESTQEVEVAREMSVPQARGIWQRRALIDQQHPGAMTFRLAWGSYFPRMEQFAPPLLPQLIPARHAEGTQTVEVLEEIPMLRARSPQVVSLLDQESDRGAQAVRQVVERFFQQVARPVLCLTQN